MMYFHKIPLELCFLLACTPRCGDENFVQVINNLRDQHALVCYFTLVFVICSLRNNMFELADRLVGIYKTDNCTKSITINPGSFAVCEQPS